MNGGTINTRKYQNIKPQNTKLFIIMKKCENILNTNILVILVIINDILKKK